MFNYCGKTLEKVVKNSWKKCENVFIFVNKLVQKIYAGLSGLWNTNKLWESRELFYTNSLYDFNLLKLSFPSFTQSSIITTIYINKGKISKDLLRKGGIWK